MCHRDGQPHVHVIANRVAPERRLGKWRGQGKWRAGRSAVGRNAAARSGTMAPAASLVLLRGRERMGRTDWEEA